MRLNPSDSKSPQDFRDGKSLPGLKIRRRIGHGAGLGFGRCGSLKFGDSRRYGGVYQKRVTGYNNLVRRTGAKRRSYYVRMRSYRPTIPYTESQVLHFGKFADAVLAWNNLTDSEKAVYNERARRKSRRGRNLFISEYMRTPTS